MRIVIPTAGLGTRLRPHTWSKPKPLVSVAGKPVLGHVLDKFESLPHIEEAVFIIGYLGDQIREYVERDYPGLNARFVVQEEMLGQSHAIWLARQGLTGPMLMAFVDTLIEVDLSQLAHETADAVAWVKEVEDPRRFGVVEVGEDGWVHRLTEKPDDMSNNLAVVGFYYFQQAEALIAAIEEQMQSGQQLAGEWYLADAINVMLERGLRMRAEAVEVWEDCGKPEPLLATNRYLLDHGRDNTSDIDVGSSQIVGPVFVHPEAVLDNATVGPHASIGAGCQIINATVSDSIVEAGAIIQDSKLERSIIGREARVVGFNGSLNLGDTSEVVAL